jgi:hypothetical protein
MLPVVDICRERDRLFAKWLHAAKVYYAATTDLALSVGTANQGAFPSLLARTGKAWMMSQEAFTNYQSHLHEHGCGHAGRRLRPAIRSTDPREKQPT